MKNIYLIHGWGGSPNSDWFPWLKAILEERGHSVASLNMPTPNEPDPITWPSYLETKIPRLDQNTYLIGHSIGCQAIMRYLAVQPEGTKIGGVIFVAPFIKLVRQESHKDDQIRLNWDSEPFNFEDFKATTQNIICIFSDDDPDVELKQNEPFFKTLGARTIILKGQGHFSDDDGTTELPIVIEELNKI